MKKLLVQTENMGYVQIIFFWEREMKTVVDERGQISDV